MSFQPFAGISLGVVAARPRSLSSSFFCSAAAPVCPFETLESEGRTGRFSATALRGLGWRGRRKRLTPSANNRAPNLCVWLLVDLRRVLGIAVGMRIFVVCCDRKRPAIAVCSNLFPGKPQPELLASTGDGAMDDRHYHRRGRPRSTFMAVLDRRQLRSDLAPSGWIPSSWSGHRRPEDLD